MPVRRAKTRDRGADGAELVRFSSAILPKFARRAPLVDAVLPILYLRGVSSGDMAEALQALVGADAGSLSAPHISLARSAG